MSYVRDRRETLSILDAVGVERDRQERRKAEGRFTHTCADPDGMNDYERLAVLVEEVGEVAREVLTGEGRRLARDSVGTDSALFEELIQVAAVAVAWSEAVKAR
jgi:hypothetical protein